jgi:hypothetical protein
VGVATAATSVVASSPAFATQASCCRANTFYTLIPTCQPETTVTDGCAIRFSNTIQVCRRTPTSTMTMSRLSNGTARPYFDEVGVLIVTSPTGVVRSQNYIGWQNDCRLVGATLPDVGGFGSGNGSPCGPTNAAVQDVTPLFGNQCGLFTVTIQVRNGFTPYGWGSCFLRGT